MTTVLALVLSLGYWLLALALLPFFGLMALVTIAAFLSRRPRSSRVDADTAGSPRLLVVIPAHNEEANVGATVASCLDSTYDPSRFHICVIADNCTDDTAFQARQAGAEVYERTDETRRSKGYALEDFFETRRRKTHEPGQGSNPYDFDAVIVIDADTLIDRALLSSIARAWAEGSDWIQCYYTVSNPDASWRTRLLTYAFSLFNGVWLLGQDELGLGSGFRGNGMAFSARGLTRIPWKAYGLVEDHEFSWMLRVAGERVHFLPDARVYGEMVTRGRGAVSQRRRWEEGRSSLRANFLRPVLNSRALSLPDKLLNLLDLFMPPLMPLLAAFLLALTAILFAGTGWLPGLLPLIPLLTFMTITFIVYAISPFLLIGLPFRYLASFPMIPYYAVWKLAATFGSKTTSWVRTERETSAKGRG
jgi:cellulose synthase/poly-beta-1,6-N-acetylglucosamine synthase-like glycosyltransferase